MTSTNDKWLDKLWLFALLSSLKRKKKVDFVQIIFFSVICYVIVYYTIFHSMWTWWWFIFIEAYVFVFIYRNVKKSLKIEIVNTKQTNWSLRKQKYSNKQKTKRRAHFFVHCRFKSVCTWLESLSSSIIITYYILT